MRRLLRTGDEMASKQFTVARIGQFTLRAHWSLLPAVLVLCVALAPLYTAETQLSALAIGMLSAVLLYGSVLVHELAHAAAALHVGLPIRAIVLFAFGGWTEIDERRLRPGDELMIAAVGPLASLALASGWWGLTVIGPPGPLKLLTTALALTNAGLAIVNLLPCYPLDGGRVLKSALWYLMDNEVQAARSGALIARACGWCIAAAGIVTVAVSGDLVAGITLGVCGYAVGQTAAEGVRRFLVLHSLRDLRVADMMQRAFQAVEPDMLLDQFVGQFVLGQPLQSFPVVRQPGSALPQPLLGLMTMRNLRRFSLSQWALTRVEQAMTPAGRIPALAPETSADTALWTLLESGEEQLPVMVSGQLLGMLRRRDLAHFLHERLRRYG
jgi:Zn-dependent protease